VELRWRAKPALLLGNHTYEEFDDMAHHDEQLTAIESVLEPQARSRVSSVHASISSPTVAVGGIDATVRLGYVRASLCAREVARCEKERLDGRQDQP
jgi:hypothetical protein